MLMSNLVHISIPCKAHLNMKIETVLYKFITTFYILQKETQMSNCAIFTSVRVLTLKNN